MIKNIMRHGKLYLPKDVLHIDVKKPWKTKCSVPDAFRTFATDSLDEGLMTEQSDIEEPDGEDRAFQTHLILSKRSFYRAFKGNALTVMDLIKKISPALEVQILPQDRLLSPIWESKSHTIATNLLNEFFEDVMRAIGLPANQWESFFACLKEEKLEHPLVCTTASKIMAGKFIETILPLQSSLAHESLLDTKYFKKWSAINKTITSLNE